MSWVRTTLDWWFGDHDARDWFQGGAAFDAAVAATLGPLRDAQSGKEAEAFLIDADTALAAIILFDQVPRNVDRGTARAFESDPLARAIADGAVARGYDHARSEAERLFFYLPFEHSEDLADQDRAVALITPIGNAEWTRYAEAHRDVIARFGRFPHRNAALGRPDAPGEAEAVADGAAF